MLGVVVERRHVETEVYLGRSRRSCDVHQAISADIAVGETSTDIQVGETDTLHGILCLEVEGRSIRVATKADGTARHELEVFLDGILDCQLIDAMVYQIVAVEVEVTFIIIGGT